MFCAACVNRVEKAISGAGGVNKAKVSLLTNSAVVEFKDKADDEEVVKAVTGAGYTCTLDIGESAAKRRKERNRELKFQLIRVVAAFALSVLVMYFAMAHMMGWPGLGYLVDQSVALSLSVICMALYYGYFYHGLKALFTLHPDMLSLVSLGSLISFSYSLYVYIEFLLTGAMGHTYFDSAAMILFFVSLGKLLEAVAKAQSTSSLEALLALMPEKALLEKEGQEPVEVEASSLRSGDVILVKPGSKVPADAEIVDGFGNLEEAALTGESAPVYKSTGDKVLSGSMNLTGSFRAKVTAVGEETSLSKVAKMVEEAASSKGRLSALADRISAYFVPAIITIAVVTFAIWIGLTRDVEDSLRYGVSTLVVACPCALGLATPVAVMVGAGRGSKLGILFKDAASFETLSKAKALVIDKTGTLTTGHLEIVRCEGFGGDSLEIVNSLEALSEHPLAWSIALYLSDKGVGKRKVDDFQNIPGEGIKGHVGGLEVLVGNKRLLLGKGISGFPEQALEEAENGLLVTYAAIGGKIVGYFAAEDSLKEGSREAIAALKKAGVEVVLASGDSLKRTQTLAESVGITRFYGEVKPEEKELIVKELRKEFQVVAMCGDGVNDAPALKAADVGIAIGTGTELAVDSSDVVLRDGSLGSLENAYFLSRRVKNNILMNLFWAFIYNIVLIPVAAGAFSGLGFDLDPMWASLAMALSSLFVILNALRIKAVRLKPLGGKQ